MTDDFPPTLPEAYAEIEKALRGHEDQSEDFIRALARRIDAVIAQVQLFPESGAAYLFGTRRLLLRPLPYQLIYTIQDGVVRIIAFAHTSQEPAYWADRLN